jgi:DNA-binding MarR family transcriptional regulator
MKPNIRENNKSSVNWIRVSLLFNEVNLLHFRMQSSDERIHRVENLTAAERSVIYILANAEGSISDLSDMRNVTRQRMQQIVKKLELKKIIQARPNRRHASSPIYSLSRHGRTILLRIIKREKKFYKSFFLGKERKINETIHLLKETRTFFESQS